MTSLDLLHIGSFRRGQLIETDNPAEEAWRRLARIGTVDLWSEATPDRADIDWDAYKEYACLRIRQSLEFRAASSGASLLTRPLTLYYSFLNAVRAALALGPEVIPKAAHGLRHHLGADLWSCSAELRAGTFTDLLEWRGTGWSPGATITLGECLSRIPEMAGSFLSPSRGRPNTSLVQVRSRMSGKLVLEFREEFVAVDEFRENWALHYPKLASRFSLGETGATLNLINEAGERSTYESVCDLCDELLIPRLMWGPSPWWFAEREDNAAIVLPRIANYVVAMFILSSLVRYEPDLLADAALPTSEAGWFLAEFLASAHRFFPQLLLGLIHRSPIYFTTAV